MKKIKEHPEVDTELPSLQQIGLMGSSIIFALFSGFLIDWIGLGPMYGIVTGIALIATIAACMIQEERSHVASRPKFFWSQVCNICSNFKDTVYFKTVIWQFLASFTFDITGAITYWYNDVAHYSKGFQGMVVMVGWIVAIIGVIVTASFGKNVRYRTLYCIIFLFQAIVSSLDIILVCVAKGTSTIPSLFCPQRFITDMPGLTILSSFFSLIVHNIFYLDK